MSLQLLPPTYDERVQEAVRGFWSSRLSAQPAKSQGGTRDAEDIALCRDEGEHRQELQTAARRRSRAEVTSVEGRAPAARDRSGSGCR